MPRRKSKEIQAELDRLGTKLEMEKALFDDLNEAEAANSVGMSARKIISKTRGQIASLEWVLNKT